jgi:hypothetical protein
MNSKKRHFFIIMAVYALVAAFCGGANNPGQKLKLSFLAGLVSQFERSDSPKSVRYRERNTRRLQKARSFYNDITLETMYMN